MSNSKNPSITPSEKSAIEFHARCCKRAGRTEAVMLCQIRRSHGWHDAKEAIALKAFRAEA